MLEAVFPSTPISLEPFKELVACQYIYYYSGQSTIKCCFQSLQQHPRATYLMSVHNTLLLCDVLLQSHNFRPIICRFDKKIENEVDENTRELTRIPESSLVVQDHDGRHASLCDTNTVWGSTAVCSRLSKSHQLSQVETTHARALKDNPREICVEG